MVQCRRIYLWGYTFGCKVTLHIRLFGSLSLSESKQKQKTQSQILNSATRCIYCEAPPLTIEHMPPKGMFEARDRPKGWEFACCGKCNENTRIADSVAQLLAFVDPKERQQWKTKRIKDIFDGIKRKAPRLAEELSLRSKHHSTFVRHRGVLQPIHTLKIDGPALTSHLNAFSAKLAMASFANFVGRPLEMDGLIYSQWYLNLGVPLDVYHAHLSIMPGFAQLMQGKKVSGEQFRLHYNSDNKSIIAAMINFHNSLTVVTTAVDGPVLTDPIKQIVSKIVGRDYPGSQLTSPREADFGGLLKFRSSN